MIALAAVSKNNVIGKDGVLPWRSRADFRWFKKMTMDKTIVCGRNTYEKLPPLKGRRLIVLSSKLDIIENAEGWPMMVTDNIFRIPPDAIICGGANVYKQFLPKVKELFLTEIDLEVEGDTYFPPFVHFFKRWSN